MCNAHPPRTDDLDDPISDIWDNIASDDVFAADMVPELDRPIVNALVDHVERLITEPCPKCNGSGRFIGYTGRYLGPCHRCKGSGKLTFKRSFDERKARRDRKAERKQEATNAWRDAHPEEVSWMIAKWATFDFAARMLEAVNKYGSLTERQLDAVRRCIAKDKTRDEERAARQAKAQAEAVSIDVSRIHQAFELAVRAKIARPKLRLGDFTFKLGKDQTTVLVIDKARDTMLGKVVEGKFQRRRECDDATAEQIIACAADPAAAAVAYGKRTGSCAICGRRLDRDESINRGIGPICAERFGFDSINPDVEAADQEMKAQRKTRAKPAATASEGLSDDPRKVAKRERARRRREARKAAAQ